MTFKGFYSLVVCAMLLAGVGFCLFGLGDAIYYPYFRSHSAVANGVITAIIRDDSNDGTYFCPEFSFQTPDAHSYKVTSTTCPSSSEFTVGQAVSILYKPSDPTDAFIDSFGQFRGIASWELKTGTVSLLISSMLFWFARRRGIPIKWGSFWPSSRHG